MTDATKMRIFEFIAMPAHAWLWLCAKLVGGEFWFGPVGDFEEDD